VNPRYEYRALLACDIAGSAGRGEQRLQEIRRVLRSGLSEALDAADLDARDFTYVDTGDGCQLVAPAALPKARLLFPLLPELGTRIREHNRHAGPATRLRVRAAVHAGEIRLDPEGTVSGAPFEALARLLDSAPLRQAALAGTSGSPVAAILSQHFYEETIGHGYEGLEADAFTAADVRVKEYGAQAWLWYPGSPVGPRVESVRDTGCAGQPAEPEPRTVEQFVQATGNGTVFAVHEGDQYIRHNDRG
jgi:class 3 adenylate cyclase